MRDGASAPALSRFQYTTKRYEKQAKQQHFDWCLYCSLRYGLSVNPLYEYVHIGCLSIDYSKPDLNRNRRVPSP